MDRDFLHKIIDNPEYINEHINNAMKKVNDIGDERLSNECLDFLTKAKGGEMTANEAAEIGRRLIEKYADRD